MIKIRDMSKKFDEQLYSDVNILLPNNGLFVLKGHNGSGKSTFLRIIAGLDSEYEGEIFYNNQLIDKKNASTYTFDHVSYLSQNPLILKNLTVLENVLYPYYSKDKKKALELLNLVGLQSIASQKADTISKGEKARLSLARGLFKNPDILLLDEMTANLDDESLKIVNEIIKKEALKRLVIVSSNSKRDEELIDNNIISIANKKITLINDIKETNQVQNGTKLNKSNFDIAIEEVKHHKISSILLLLISIIFPFASMFMTVSSTISDDNLYNLASEAYLANTNAYEIEVSSKNNFDQKYVYSTNYMLKNDFFIASNESRYSIGGSGYGIVISESFDESEIELVNGTYPAQDKEVIVSEAVFEKLITEYSEDKTMLDKNQIIEDYLNNNEIITVNREHLHIVGSYKVFGTNLDRYEKLLEDDLIFFSRVAFGFGIDTIFAGPEFTDETKLDRYIVARNDVTESIIDKNFLNKEDIGTLTTVTRFDIAQSMYSPLFIFDSKTIPAFLYEINFLNLFSYILIVLYAIYLITYFILYAFSERKRCILCRALGASRKHQVLGKIAVFTFVLVMGNIIGYFAFSMTNLILNNFINMSQLGTPVNLLTFSPMVLMILLIESIVAIIIFALFVSLYISPKQIEKDLALMEGGND